MSIYTAAKASFVYKVPLLTIMVFLCDLGPGLPYLRCRRPTTENDVFPRENCSTAHWMPVEGEMVHQRGSVTIWRNHSLYWILLEEFIWSWKTSFHGKQNSMFPWKPFSMEMDFHLEGEVKETMPIIGVQMAFWLQPTFLNLLERQWKLLMMMSGSPFAYWKKRQ